MEGLLGQQAQGQQPPRQQGGPIPAEDVMDDQEEVPEEQDQALIAAYQWVHSQLYQGPVGEQIAEVVGSMPNPVAALSDISYKLTQAADTQTQGQIAEENLVPLAVFVMNEVLEMAEKAGATVSSADVSKIFKKMIITYLKDNGMDTTQIEQAMAAVDDNEFAAMADGMTAEQSVPEQSGGLIQQEA
jgi:hypothetical protein